MERKRLVVIAAAVVVGSLLLGVCIFKTIDINKKYPQTKIQHVVSGEPYEMKPGVFLTVTDTSWMTNQEYIEEYGENSDINKEEDAKIIFVDVLAKNNSGKKVSVDFSNFYVEKPGYYNGLAMDVFFGVPDQKEIATELKAQEEYRTTLAYVIYGYQFGKEQWKEIENQRFFIVNERYPVKTCWDLESEG